MKKDYSKLDHPRRPLQGYLLIFVGSLLALSGLFSFVFFSLPGFLIHTAFPDAEIPPGIIDLITLPLSCFLVGAGGILIKKARKFIAPMAETVLAKDQRPPVLLLRAFVDDELLVEARASQLFFFSDKVSLEEAISPVLSTLGPVIAIGRPGEIASPLGAAREYVSHDTWTNAVESWIHRACRVVMIMGSLANQKGLSWELKKIQEFTALHKLILVLPPQDSLASIQRWHEYESFLGVTLPPFTGGELFVAFDRDLMPLVKSDKNVGKSDGRADLYKTSLKAFLQELAE